MAEAEAANMVCPNCNAFQPRASVCSQCGILVEKAPDAKDANKSPFQRIVVADPDERKTNKLWIVLLLACLIFYFSKNKDEEIITPVSQSSGTQEPSTDTEGQLAAIAAVDPDAALKVQRDRVLTRLETLQATLYRLSAEDRFLPSEEVGLQTLVNEGLLTEADVTDEWGNTFVYRLEEGEQIGSQRQYAVFLHSRGPDGISGNSDDVVLP